MVSQENVTYLNLCDINIQRQDYTTHGLQLNQGGKKKLCKSIAQVIFNKKKGVNKGANESLIVQETTALVTAPITKCVASQTREEVGRPRRIYADLWTTNCVGSEQ
jgi:hypothetical protein